MNSSSGNQNDSCSPQLDESAVPIFVSLNIVNAAISTAGNTLIICIVLKTNSLKTCSNYFILSLALNDLFTGALVTPLYIRIMTTKVWMDNHLLMTFENFLWTQSITCSSFSLCAISIDRYCAICHVFHYYSIMTKQRCLFIISGIWVFSVAFGSLTLVLNTLQVSSLWTICTLVTVVIPFFVITFCYFHIFKALSFQIKNISKTSTVTKREDSTDNLKIRKGALTIAIIILVFIIFYSPNLVFAITEITTKDPCKKMEVYKHWIWGISIGNCSSSVNPFVYAARNEEFRHGFMKLQSFRKLKISADA